MNVTTHFAKFVQSHGGSIESIRSFPQAAGSQAEAHLPEIAKGLADHFELIGNPATSPAQVDAAKAKVAALQERLPEAFEGMADLADKAAPESVAIGYKAGPEPGMFSLAIHNFGLFNSPPTIYAERTGTLYVDTTPGQEGLQYAFVPSKG